jgi:hypothetical protein
VHSDLLHILDLSCTALTYIFSPRTSFFQQFQAEAEHDVSEETKAALLTMWAQRNESLPVFCVNHTSGVRADGTFKIIDGKKRIVLEDGTVMEPVDFEKAGDRGSTRNWQLSICVAGGHIWS